MEHTTPRQSVRIAGFLFAGAVALMAQSPVNQPGVAKAELMAFNTTTAPYPTVSVFPNQSQSLPSDKGASSEIMVTQPVEQFQPTDLLKKVPAPSSSTLAMVKDHSPNSYGSSWFTAGPQALPISVRTDPAFGMSSSAYGAAPAAVQFHFGKK